VSPEPSTFRFTADRGDAGRRLDVVIVRRLSPVSRLSRTEAQAWIDGGAVEIDGRTGLRPSTRVPEGASIAVTLPPTAHLRERPEAHEAPLRIVYEDEHLLAIDKPAGVVVHPTYKQSGRTVVNAVLWHLRGRSDLTPGILTRLDKDTSGLVLVALSPGVHAAAQRDAAAGRVRKEYLAVVTATPAPASGRITLPLARDPRDRRRVVATRVGAPSETRYEVVATSDRGALVRCELVTGRTHQIRVHLSASGWPIAGDAVYGVLHPQIRRQALHAWRVALPHPVTRAPLSLTASLPDDFTAVLQACDLPMEPATLGSG
jgi:23S rRNA pseudouridine1911/1915/1917 synthase